MNSPYRFVLEVGRPESTTLHREVLTPDWEPAVECARLTGLRAYGIWEHDEPWLEPIWHRDIGEPTVEGFRLHLARGDRRWCADFETSRYFADIARSVTAALVAEGRLTAGERVCSAVSAYPVDEAIAAGSALGFETSDRAPSIGLVNDRSFAELVARTRPWGTAHHGDVGIVVPESTLGEIYALTQASDAKKEVGGILLGYLCRDSASSDIGVEVTAQVPARHTVGDSTRLTFTPDTWTDVRAVLALRRKGERMVGWWHSHPAREWCKACSRERQGACPLAKAFLSPEDRALHRVIFPSAFTVALVVTDAISGLDTSLFGWRGGVLEPRGFALLADGDARAVDVPAVSHL